jgi:hypothetical protein
MSWPEAISEITGMILAAVVILAVFTDFWDHVFRRK